MGLFDFFKRDKGAPPAKDDGTPVDKKLAAHRKTAANKRAQNYDRDEALRALINTGTPAAAECLLQRFTLKVDPSITDQEEKQLAFDGIVSIGMGERGKRLGDEGKETKEISDEPLTMDEVAELNGAVVGHIRAYCKKAENLNHPLKLMRALLDDDAYEQQLLSLLRPRDTEYVRNVEPKINLLVALEQIRTDETRELVELYLDDVNETVRFHAVHTTFEQGDKKSFGPLLELMKKEESVRVKNKVAEGVIRRDWKVPKEIREEFGETLRDAYEYCMDTNGTVRKA